MLTFECSVSRGCSAGTASPRWRYGTRTVRVRYLFRSISVASGCVPSCSFEATTPVDCPGRRIRIASFALEESLKHIEGNSIDRAKASCERCRKPARGHDIEQQRTRIGRGDDLSNMSLNCRERKRALFPRFRLYRKPDGGGICSHRCPVMADPARMRYVSRTRRAFRTCVRWRTNMTPTGQTRT